MTAKEEALPKRPSCFSDGEVWCDWARRMVEKLEKLLAEDLEKFGLATSDMERSRYSGRRYAWTKFLEALKDE